MSNSCVYCGLLCMYLCILLRFVQGVFIMCSKHKNDTYRNLNHVTSKFCRTFTFAKLLFNGQPKNICIGTFFQFPIRTELEEIQFKASIAGKTTVRDSVTSVQTTMKPFCKHLRVCDQRCALGHLGDHH